MSSALSRLKIEDSGGTCAGRTRQGGRVAYVQLTAKNDWFIPHDSAMLCYKALSARRETVHSELR